MVEEEAAACNSIANCNCSVYSYHSAARFGSALHQKHWHRKHLRWALEQRRAPKVPFSASSNNYFKLYSNGFYTIILSLLMTPVSVLGLILMLCEALIMTVQYSQVVVQQLRV